MTHPLDVPASSGSNYARLTGVEASFESGTFNRTPPPLHDRQGYRRRAPTGQRRCAARKERLTCGPLGPSEVEASVCHATT